MKAIRDYAYTCLQMMAVAGERYARHLIPVALAIFVAVVIFFRVSNDTLFAVTSGALTLLGVLLTLLMLHGAFERFQHIRPLLRRMTQVLKRASPDLDEYVCLLGYYPAFGSTSLAASPEVHAFVAAFADLKRRLPVVALTYDERGRTTQLRSNTKHFGGDLETAMTLNNQLIASLHRDQGNHEGTRVVEIAEGSVPPLPTFQLLFTARTAFFFTVFEMPEDVATPGAEPPPPAHRSSGGAALFGFVTQDPDYIENFRTSADYFLRRTTNQTLDEVLVALKAELATGEPGRAPV